MRLATHTLCVATLIGFLFDREPLFKADAVIPSAPAASCYRVRTLPAPVAENYTSLHVGVNPRNAQGFPATPGDSRFPLCYIKAAPSKSGVSRCRGKISVRIHGENHILYTPRPYIVVVYLG